MSSPSTRVTASQPAAPAMLGRDFCVQPLLTSARKKGESFGSPGALCHTWGTSQPMWNHKTYSLELMSLPLKCYGWKILQIANSLFWLHMFLINRPILNYSNLVHLLKFRFRARRLRPSPEILSDMGGSRRLGLLLRMQTALAILCFTLPAAPWNAVLLEQEGSLSKRAWPSWDTFCKFCIPLWGLKLSPPEVSQNRELQCRKKKSTFRFTQIYILWSKAAPCAYENLM